MTINKDKFFNKTIINGITYQDILSFSFLDFEDYIKPRSVNIIYLNEKEVNSPDMISYNYYGDESYWWIICYINKVLDPFVDLTLGKMVIIPKIEDILSFISSLQSNSLSSNNNSKVSI